MAKFIGYRLPVAGLIATAGCVLGLAALSTPARAYVPERQLAGVKIFSPISVVVKKFGSPDEIKVGATTTNANGTGGAAGPGMGGPMGGGMPPWMQGGGGGGMPPWMGGPGGAGPGGDTGTATGPSKDLVTYIYDQNDSGTLEFTFSSDGHVIQIRATGYKGSVRTVKGIALGMLVSDVIGRYGAPQNSTIANGILTMTYTDKFHATFQVYNKKVVGITVAAVE